jgi:hypothetical protein
MPTSAFAISEGGDMHWAAGVVSYMRKTLRRRIRSNKFDYLS